MKNILILLSFLFLSISGKSQSETTFELTGTVQQIAYTQGGIEIPEEYRMPHPLPNRTFLIVRYNGADKVPSVVQKVRTDSAGRFNIHLPEGEYGIVQPHQRMKLYKGQFSPQPERKKSEVTNLEFELDNGYYNSQYWSLNTNAPIQVGPNSINGVTLTYTDIRVCYMCP